MPGPGDALEGHLSDVQDVPSTDDGAGTASSTPGPDHEPDESGLQPSGPSVGTEDSDPGSDDSDADGVTTGDTPSIDVPGPDDEPLFPAGSP